MSVVKHNVLMRAYAVTDEDIRRYTVALRTRHTGKTQRYHASGAWERRLERRRVRGDWSRTVHSMSVAGRNNQEEPLSIELFGKRYRK